LKFQLNCILELEKVTHRQSNICTVAGSTKRRSWFIYVDGTFCLWKTGCSSRNTWLVPKKFLILMGSRHLTSSSACPSSIISHTIVSLFTSNNQLDGFDKSSNLFSP
jgi:hypothetical protein